jgi:4-amino-4-deoxy-L-arabinose transferase-like glycosyltransferase
VGKGRNRFAWTWLAVILLAGLVLRGLYLRECAAKPDFARPIRDAAYHDYWARGLVTGDWTPPHNLPDPQLNRTPYFRPPGYPYFLAAIYRLFGVSPWAPRIVQLLLGVVNALLAFALGRRWFDEKTGLLFAAFMSFSWIFIYFECELLPPVLLVTFTLLTMYALGLLAERDRPGIALAAGGVLGWYALFLPNALLFAPVAAGWVAWRTRRVRSALAFAAGVALALAPATIRNYAVSREFVLISANGGINLFFGNNDQSNGVDPSGPGVGAWSCFEYPDIVRRIEQEQGSKLSYRAADAYFVRRAWTFVKEQPARALRLTARKACLFWGPREVGNEKDDESERAHSVLLRNLPFPFPLVLAFALVGAGLLVGEGRGRPPGAALAGALIGTIFLSYLPFFVAARYRVPILPLLLLFAAHAVERFDFFVTHRQTGRLLRWLAAGAVFYAIAAADFGLYVSRTNRWHSDRGIALANGERWEDAAAEFRLAAESDPRDFMARYHLATALARLDRPEEAAVEYAESLRWQEDFDDAHVGFGKVLAVRGRVDEAMREFSRATAINPRHAEAWACLGAAHAGQGRFEESAAEYARAIEIRPGYVQAHIGMGYALLAAKKNREAAAQFAVALKISPRDTDAQAGLRQAADAESP